MTDQISELVAGLDDERYHAMLAKDVAKLEELLDPRLRYTHSNGVVDTKDSYLKGLKEGVWDYKAISREDQTIIPLGDAALVFNHLQIDLVVRGTAKKVDSLALAVWSRSDGPWRLVAVQSGSLAAK